jgi:ribosome-associated protein
MAIKKTTSDTKTLALKEKKAPVKKAAPKKTTKKVAPKKSAVKTTKAPAVKKAVAKKVSPSIGKVKKVTPEPVVKSPSQLLIDAAVEGILDIKGKNIAVLDLTKIHNRVCDYYIITQADSSTQVNAIADSVREMVKKTIGERPYHSEGFQNSEWILIDYVNVVVHVFQSHIREFYNLEALWADAEVTKIAFD